MKKTFGIGGFGRIGRVATRVWWQHHRDTLDLKVINTSGSMDLEGWAYLLKYDSNYGAFPGTVSYTAQQTKEQVTDDNPVLGTLSLDGYEIPVTAQRDPSKLAWQSFGAATVIESTGSFLTEDKAKLYLRGGAQRVVLSAPPKGSNIQTGVLGVNDLSADQAISSNASCTTQCVATVAQVMVTQFGVEKATLTTTHSYTDDQNLHDNSHKDLRRARGAAQNIIPTSTGAAKTTGKVIPELDGLFDGVALRVPVPVGSLSDMVFVTKKATTVEEVNAALEAAAQSEQWRGILAVSHEPLVSSDIVGRPESSIVDLSLTQVIGGNLVKIISWYDNEWGYANRLVEQVAKL